MSRRYSVDDIMALGPCKSYSRPRVSELWAGRDALTAREIGALSIPARDRIWVLIELLPSDIDRRLWACDVAEDAWMRFGAPDFPLDRRPLACIAVARRYAVGEATDEELFSASTAVISTSDRPFTRQAAQAAYWAASPTATGFILVSDSARNTYRHGTWDDVWAARHHVLRGDPSDKIMEDADRTAAWEAAGDTQIESLVTLLEEAGDD